MLTRFFGVAPQRVGIFLLPFAAGNLLGPLVLGRLFDSVGRKPMIVFTYAASGTLLLLTGGLAWVFVRATQLSGLASEEMTSLRASAGK